ncbi:MAG: FAD-binding oxidoreductase [Chloroflexota bacterium]|nr:MAG: hypothetical protein DIU68_04680 [Chloroflexota bacterium]
MGTAQALATGSKLKQQVSGDVFAPGDAQYDQARRGWNLSVDHYPALVLVANDARDVAAGVRFAREAGLGVAVQTTGHGVQRPADDSLLIVMSRLNGATVDPEARTARVEGGAVWQSVLEKSTPHALAPLLGSSPHVGVVGYTLNGGLGWLARRYGLAVDHVRRVEVVTADGEIHRASATENSDLFWGLRGAGGNFGVITALEIDLFPVATVYGGHLIYPGELAREALGFFRDWTATLPDAMTSSIAVMKFPSAPQIPEALRGQIQVIVRAVYAGDAGEGASLIQPWRDWRAPKADTFREMPFSEIAAVSNDPVQPTAGHGAHEMFAELSDDALDIIVRHATNAASPVAMHELRHAGGAIARVGEGENAVTNRDAHYYYQMGGPVFGPDGKAKSAAYIRQVRDDLHAFVHGGVYLNFMGTGEGYHRGRDAFGPEGYQRLLALKAKYDPDNLFRFAYQLTPPEA